MNPLLIFGASTRAAAFSAIRAGFDPICGDLFADADLRAVASVLHVPDYPHHLRDAVSQLSAGIPWIFTGALENSPAEVERLSARHPLWGNSATVLRRCRDPWSCSAALERHGIAAVELCDSATPPPRSGSWLMKPLRSSAGRAIKLWGPATKPLAEPHYFQRFIQGTPISGAFLSTVSKVHLLGVSLQLVGLSELQAPEFGYCGSIYPRRLLPVACYELIEQIGNVISSEFGLRGLFGIDFMFDGQQVRLIEINPRYTASMELIEYGRQLPLLELHRKACAESSDMLIPEETAESQDRYYAKVIFYADRNARAPDLSQWTPKQITISELPQLADIPVADTEIVAGQPVFTCLGEGLSPGALVQELCQQAQELWATFPK